MVGWERWEPQSGGKKQCCVRNVHYRSTGANVAQKLVKSDNIKSCETYSHMAFVLQPAEMTETKIGIHWCLTCLWATIHANVDCMTVCL